MELLPFVILVFVGIFFFYLGKRFGDQSLNNKMPQYIQLQESEVPETETISKQADRQQKEFERLTKELNEYMSREQALVNEIKQLRSKLDENPQPPHGTVDLLSDKDFDSLLDEASKGAQTNLLNDDDFDKQLNEATL